MIILMAAGGLGMAASGGRDLASLTEAERESRAAHEAQGTDETRRAWVNSLAQLGWAHAEEGRHAEAVTPYRTALAELPDDVREANPEFVAILHDGLGRALQNTGAFDEAERHLREGLEIRAAVPGGEVRLGLSEGHLGLLLLVRGRYTEAERLFHSALAHTPEGDHGLLAHRHDAFGRYYLAIRSYEQAAEQYRRAIAHASVGAGADDPLLLDLRASYALCRFRCGDAAGALRETADLLEGEAQDETERLRRADLLNLRATIHAELGEYAQAASDLERALETVSAIRGEGHPAAAQLLTNLGAIRLKAGEAAEALEVLGQSRGILENAVESHHQALVELLYLIADCHLALDREDEARRAVVEARRAAEALMRELVAGGTERELLTFRSQVDLHSIVCHLGDAELIAQSLLDGQGQIMDAILDRRAKAGSRAAELQALRNKLDRLRLAGPQEHAEQIEQLERQMRELRDRRADQSIRKKRTWVDVRGALAEHSVFVDCVRYLPRDAKPGEARYGAVVLAPGREPVWVPLADERMMSRLDLLHRSLETRANILRTGGGQAGTPVAPLLSLLHSYFWAPVAKALPEGTRRVVLCPEGRLHLLPWAALRSAEGVFLCEELPDLRLVDSGRALLDGTASDGDTSGWTVLGVSDFARYREEAKAGTGRWLPRWADKLADVSDLPTVKRELDSLRRLAPAGSRFLLDEAATDTALRALIQVPEVLHVASHGLHVALGGSRDLASDPSALYENGVLLALEDDDDGILFPEEAAALDLRGTRLVTLSTCRSALGRPVSGEGLLGLRRGFAKAGARNILASLWEIPDRSTAEFMEHYYAGIAAGGDPGPTLWRMQAEKLRALRDADPRGAEMETAILSYGGFVLSSPGGR